MKISKKQIIFFITLLKDPKKILIMFFLIAFAYILNYDGGSYINAKVSHVIDGDTIEAKFEDKKLKIRLFGIDAPESDQAYGKMAMQFLSAIALNKEVVLSVKDEDKYGRILAIVYLNDKDINQVMVKNGFAWAYEHYSDLYVNEQNYAKENKKGLWADENPIEPYKWRRQIRLK
ncbi:thermonuclease family protein [Campylobacter lari]|uniref:Endonuclease, thermonuclease family n=1 Tax=Campylobacter lari NCTC 11845 TaxID=1388749 RepID=A0A0A8HUF3_CAMLA|nr:thermonuclease family protein [Campylobacter lari]AJD01452.1 endonuclease, thermonuclease family [Campylobacter lari NCTC 11845]MCR6543314.1 thermonuclease family protein [Campylobacter lari]